MSRTAFCQTGNHHDDGDFPERFRYGVGGRGGEEAGGGYELFRVRHDASGSKDSGPDSSEERMTLRDGLEVALQGCFV